MQLIKKILFSFLVTTAMSGHAFCFKQAGETYQIDPQLLEAIAVHESRLQSSSVLENTNGTLDIGLMGINTVHLKDPYLLRAGFRSPQDMIDPCTNVKLGAWLLHRKILKWGSNWQAVGAYHSETPERNVAYQQKVSAVLLRLKKPRAVSR